MLAGCCSSLLSPRQRFRGERPAAAPIEQQASSSASSLVHSNNVQSCHFPLQDRFYASSQRSLELTCSSCCRNDERSSSVSTSRDSSQSQRNPVKDLLQTSSMEEPGHGQSSFWAERPQKSMPMDRRRDFAENMMAKYAEALWESSTRRENLKRVSENNAGEDLSEERAKRRRGSPPEESPSFSINELGIATSSSSFWFLDNSEKQLESTSEVGGSSGLSTTFFSSPEQQKSNSYEPRSVLDLEISPDLKPQRSATTALLGTAGPLFTGRVADYEQGLAIANVPDNGIAGFQQHPQEFHNGNNGDDSSDDNTGNADDDHDAPANQEQFQNPRTLQGQSGEGTVSREESQLEQGLELVNLLVSCAEAVASMNLNAVNSMISRLGDLASPEGTSPMQRVAAYFTEALTLKATRQWSQVFQPIMGVFELSDEELNTGFQLLNHISPIPKFFHYTSNEVILRAFEGKDRVHIIDFDIKQGLQWPALFHSLASRPDPPSHVRITGIGESKEELQITGERLARFAEELKLPFEFHAVVDRLEDVRLWMLHVKGKETVAVNCVLQLHQMLYDNGAPLRALLGVIQSTRPAIVTVVEQEASHNEPAFEARFLRAMQYYSAIFDMIDAALPLHSPARLKMEQYFARQIRNIVACEGQERIERHESSEKWKEFMEDSGFTSVPLAEREHLQARMLLQMYECKNYRVSLHNGRLTLSWLDQQLYTASAWKPSS